MSKLFESRSTNPAPGRPGTAPESVAEPTVPSEPLPPAPEQTGPETRTPTGAATGAPQTSNAQQGAFLTTAHGAPLRDTDHSLKAGVRGPVLLQDHHLREKISHFDHERIPERVVHARGAAAHGRFVANGAAESICAAPFLAKGAETPTFTRFSTVLGSRGSMDLARDTRGFSTRFYSEQGNFDLVGNNIPVFFIQDAIKFPDVVHAAKWHPDREIPQAQSAHDTFWDFVSLHTEAQFHTLWNMSDRGIPRSYRMMEGFGVHTFRLVNAKGQTSLVKFHWKPRLGVHSVTWEEAQITNGVDPDYHRRDLYDAIEAGAYPEWDLGVQVMPDTPDETFEGIDLLDATKIVPEELVPVQVIGTMTLDRNPVNFFAEVEQVAFNPGNRVEGIEFTNDPLLHGRLFSYLDTQITRLGGPNWNQLPINRAHAPINDMLRDGFHQDAVHGGVAPYRPNSLDAGNPSVAGDDQHAVIDFPTPVQAGTVTREQSASFDDHFSQATLFYRSLSPVERDHTIAAYTFELSKCWEQAVRERQLQCLANIDEELCAAVAVGLGLTAPRPSRKPAKGQKPSPALSQVAGTWPVAGRQVGIVVGPKPDKAAVTAVQKALTAEGVVPLLVGPRGGTLGGLTVQRTYNNAASVEFDALVVMGDVPPAPDAQPTLDAKAGAAPSTVDPRVAKLVAETWRHCKAIGLVDADSVLAASGVDSNPTGVASGKASNVAAEVLTLLAAHRAWQRFTPVTQ